METKTEKLIEALQVWAESIECVDGVADNVIFEAAQRLNELQAALQTAHASLVLARNERDEARAEIERFNTELAQLRAERDNANEREKEGVRQLYALQKSLNHVLKTRDELRVERDLAQQLGRDTATVNQQLTVRPEPSRIEIAAMLLSGFAASDTSVIHNKYNFVLTEADALIAAAKESQ